MTNTVGKLAMGLFKLGAQAVEAAVTAIDKIANQQEFEAVLAACVLVASADGHTDETERAATLAQAMAHPSLKGFGPGEVQKAFNDMHTVLGLDRVLGVETLLEKVRKVTDMESRARIASIATAIANADGDFSDSEKAMVERIRGGK